MQADLVINWHINDLIFVDTGDKLILLLNCLLREAIVADGLVEVCVATRDAELLAEGLGESRLEVESTQCERLLITNAALVDEQLAVGEFGISLHGLRVDAKLKLLLP